MQEKGNDMKTIFMMFQGGFMALVIPYQIPQWEFWGIICLNAFFVTMVAH